MKNYKIKLTALTPIHIGTGEDYEPTNFVIDNGYLYEFDEVSFYQKLDAKRKKDFLEAVESKGGESLFEIHRLIKNNKKQAIESAISKVQVSKGLEKDYDNKVGRVIQNEGGRRVEKSKVFNRFQIAKTARLSNAKRVYIPGSSLKGSMSTAFQEALFKENYKEYTKLFVKNKPQDNILKNLIVSDTTSLKTYSIVGYALNKERFEDDELGPSTKLESIYTGSQFEVDISIRDYLVDRTVTFEELIKTCNDHYLPLFEQMFNSTAIFQGQKVDEYTNSYYSDAFYDKYSEFQLKENQFLLRVGKHSGARAVTIDGKREIQVKISGGGRNRKPNRWETLEQETTTWMFGADEKSLENLVPFGWVLCEIVSAK